MRSQYRNIKSFAPNVENQQVNNPMSYCIGDTIDRNFNHGSSNSYIYGCNSAPCQNWTSSYCALGWDEFCEYSSKNTNTSYPNQVVPWNNGPLGLTNGQILIRNTAGKKYLKSMTGPCRLRTTTFDPTNASSPIYEYWTIDSYYDSSLESDVCKPIYTIKDTKNIDSDIVMNKLLEQPQIGMDILIGIYNTMRMEKRLAELNNTRLGTFFHILQQKGYVPK